MALTDNETIIALAEAINARRGNLMGSWLRNSEAEVMVAQTICACKINLEKRGEAYSIRSNGVFSRSGGGLVNNCRAYTRLLREGYFREEKRNIDDEMKTVIFPTQLLLMHVQRYLETEN